VLAALKLVTGVDLVSDLTAFFTLLGGMTDEFNARAERVQQLLGAPGTAFVIVSSAQDRPIDEAIRFRETLRREQLPFVGAIVNRVNQPLAQVEGESRVDAGGQAELAVESLEAALDLPAELAARVAACAADHSVLAARDAANIARLRKAFSGEPILQVPELTDDVHGVEALLAIHRVLFDDRSDR
jgi:anion-transporting  ArsA/GET3 family ATPase